MALWRLLWTHVTDLTVHYVQWIYHQQNKTTQFGSLEHDACHAACHTTSHRKTDTIEAGQGIFPRCSTSSKRWTKWFQSWLRASCWKSDEVMKSRSRWPPLPPKKKPTVVHVHYIDCIHKCLLSSVIPDLYILIYWNTWNGRFLFKDKFSILEADIWPLMCLFLFATWGFTTSTYHSVMEKDILLPAPWCWCFYPPWLRWSKGLVKGGGLLSCWSIFH